MKITRKEIEKYINETQKVERKKYGYKKRGHIIFKKYREYFLSIRAYATGFNNDELIVFGEVKPYYFDDVFWEVFKMSENSSEPMGLRANDAYGEDVCEIDVSDLSIDETINLVVDVIFDKKDFPFGVIDFMDWLIG